MDEFRTGNFSQAHKIKEVFREQIKSCIKSHTYSLTEGEGNISTYLQKQLAKLEEEHKERSGKKEQAVKEIRDIEQKIRDEKQALKDE
jgi:gas vesicle protein